MDWGEDDYPSYAFYGRAIQSPQEQWTLKALCRKLLAVGKGQLGAFVAGTLKSPMQHSKVEAGGTTAEQHAARRAIIVRGAESRFAMRSDYASPNGLIVHWPE